MTAKPRRDDWVTFRMPFWRWYVAAVVFGQVVYAVLNAAPALLAPDKLGWAYYKATSALGAAVIPAIFAPLMFAVVWAFPVRVGPAGIRGSNGWGWPVAMSWASIGRLSLVPFPALPMVRVNSTETRRVLWLPLFLNDFPHFAELVARYAGDDHPLTAELMKRVPDE